jgi:hypothetical protein
LARIEIPDKKHDSLPLSSFHRRIDSAMHGRRAITVAIGTKHLHTVADQDGAAILDVKQGLISTLNPTGAYVWQGLQRGDSVEAIIRNLARETGEDPTVVGPDVRQFLETLEESRLLSGSSLRDGGVAWQSRKPL